MAIDNRLWTKAILAILLALALIMPIASAFAGLSSNITANKTTLGVQGDTGIGAYNARFTTTPYQPGSYPALSSNITANIGWYELLRGNTKPNITQIFILSSTGQDITTDSLSCYVNATDFENTTLMIYYNWYNNSVQIPSLSGQTIVISDILTKVSILASSNTTTGENWTCEARAWDGYFNETDWNNATILIKGIITPGGSAGAAAGGGASREEVPQPCIEGWVCTDWSNCTDNIQTRNCTDINSCPEPKYKPAETKPCRAIPEITLPEPEKAIPLAPGIRKTGKAISKPEPGEDIIKTLMQIAKYNNIKALQKIIHTSHIIKYSIDTIIQKLAQTALQNHIKAVNAVKQAIHKLIQTAINNHIMLRNKTIQLLSILSRNAQAISLTLNHLILITIITAMLIYFRKLHKEHRRSTIIRSTVYFLLGISITGLLIHYTRFHQKTIPAYIAITAILIILIIDWFLRTLPARIRKEQRIHQRIIEKIRAKKDEIQKARKLARELAKPAPPKPKIKPKVLTREQKSRLTRIKHKISEIKQEQAAKTLHQMKTIIRRIGLTPIQKIKHTIKEKLSKKPEPKYKVSKELKSLREFDRKITKYLESKPEKIGLSETKHYTKIKNAITRIAGKTPSLEKELKQLTKDIKKAKPKHRIKDIKKKYIAPIISTTEQIKNKIKEKQKQKQKEREKQRKKKRKQLQKQIKEQERIQQQQEKERKQQKAKEQERKQQIKERKRKQQKREEKLLKKLKKQQEKEKRKLKQQTEQKLRKEMQKTSAFEKELDKYLKTTKTAKPTSDFDKLKQEIYSLDEPHKIKPKKAAIKKPRKRKLPKKYKKEIEKTLKFEKELDKYLNS